MVVLQAERLSSAGHGVLVVDLYGTGDSGGEFREARWEVWKADLSATINWLREKGVKAITLWGIRVGGLLALELALEHGDQVDRLVLWQPVVDGQSMLTQFLRLRVAADMIGGGEKRESVKSLQERLVAGELVEVAGYELAPDLAVTLKQKNFASLRSPIDTAVHWLEIVLARSNQLSLASQKVIETWCTDGVSVSTIMVIGEAFWATQEIAVVPKLVDETTHWLMQGSSRSI
jgi:exosortase A-associated hydrolase 2